MTDTNTEQAAPIQDYAIIVDPRDNVAVVKQQTTPGLVVALPDGRELQVKASVTPGHRFATRAVAAGQFVLQYGQPIGTSLGIECGDWITHENMSDDVPVIRDLPPDLHTSAPEYIPEAARETFMGFRRADGRVGTRNF